MWTIETGLTLVRAIQESSREFGYHVALGGGVLNKGASDKDIDLYFLPLNNPKYKEDEGGLVKWLTGLWGKPAEIGDYRDDGPREDSTAVQQWFARMTREGPRTIRGTTQWVETPPSITHRTFDENEPIPTPEPIFDGAWRTWDLETTPLETREQEFERMTYRGASNPTPVSAPTVYKRKLKFNRKGGDRIDIFVL